MPSLEEFAGQRKSKTCFTCQLPEDLLKQVEAARDREIPISFDVISEWLYGENHGIKGPTLVNHFRFGHHKGVVS